MYWCLATTGKKVLGVIIPSQANFRAGFNNCKDKLHPKEPALFVNGDIVQITRKLNYAKPRSGFQFRSYSTLQSSDELYKCRAQQVADWMQLNADLPQDQLQLILDKELSGRRVLQYNISSFEKLQTKFDAKASDSLWQAIQKFRWAFMIPKELRPETASFSCDTNLLNMPFVGRTAAIQKALVEVETHAKFALALDCQSLDQVRLGNTRLFAVGAPGIGKTRFGEEFPRLLAEHATSPLKQKLKNVRTVRLTFHTGKMVSPDDKKWEHYMDQVNWILTARAIHAVYNINEAYKDWASELSRLFGEELPQGFNMNTFTQELLVRDPSATAIYFHLDEVQEILSLSQDVAANVIRELSSIYAKYNTHKHLTLLLFTGTVLSDIKNVLNQKLGVGSFPLYSLPMETLEEDQIFSIISKMKEMGKLPWLRDDWKTYIPFKRLVTSTVGVPCLLELLLIACNDHGLDVNAIASKWTELIQSRYSISDKHPIYNACCLALSGKQFQLEDKLPNDPEQTVEKLRSNGCLFWGPNGELKVPFVYIGLTVLPESLVKGKYEEKITIMCQKLLTPTQALLWQDFEAFTLIYTMARLKALLHLKYTTISVQDYFHHAHTMAKNVESLEFKLIPRDYIELGQQWPASGWPIYINHNYPVHPANILSALFLNASGAPFDGFEFVELADKQEYVIFAHQNKHTADGKTKLSSKTIVDEAKKVQDAFNTWKTTQFSDDKLAALKKATKQAILVVFTNRQIENHAGYPMPSENFILISNNEHFGPFQSTTKFFQESSPASSSSV